jgi:hypothetical protein
VKIITGLHVASADHGRKDVWILGRAAIGIIASGIVYNWYIDTAQLVGNDSAKLCITIVKIEV